MTGTHLANVTVVAIAGRAILLEGPPGSGKSSLALALIDRGATLVGDDGVTIEKRGTQLFAAPHPNTRGMLEVRNVGIVTMPTTSAPLALILTLDTEAGRFPLDVGQRELQGLPLPVLPFAPGDAAQALRAEIALERHGLRFSESSQTE